MFNEIEVSWQDKITFTTNLNLQSVSSIFNEIRTSPCLKKLIEGLRNIKDEKEQSDYKKKNLPYFNLGTFENSHRKDVNLISTSFLLFDYDHLDEKLESMKSQLRNDNRVFAFFVSPRGNGLKVIYCLDKAVKDHEFFPKLYKHYAKEFKVELGASPDKTCDPSRACFFSFDPEIYVNENAVPLPTDISELVSANKGTDDEEVSDTSEIPESNILKGGLTPGDRHKALLSTVSHLIHYNLPSKSIYAIAQFMNQSNQPPKSEQEVISDVSGVLRQYKKIKGDFWSVSRNKGGRIVVDINHYQLVKFLESNGFAKLYLTNGYTYINSVDNRIKEKMSTEIKDFILSTVKRKNYQGLTNDFKDEILNTLIASSNKYLGDKVFECVESREMELLKDTPALGHAYFKNCFVEVTGDEIKTRPYTELNGLIWEDQIIDADFDIADDFNDSMFRKFLWNVSAKRQDRFNSLVSGIGYLLHGYKDMSKAKAVVFCDEKVSDDPNGRTGKSLASVAISKLKRSVRMDGKSIDFKNRFAYQQVERTTQVLEFNDVRKTFDFESLFSIITDALNVEKKNGHKFLIDFKESPKVLISTNYTIAGTGDSFTDRLFEVEFAPHYSAKHKPTDEFGCVFFDDWDKQEWNRFYNFMLWCEQFYLKNGVVAYEKVNLGLRKLMDNTAPEFLNFVEDQIVVGLEYDKNDIFYKFTIKYPDYSHLKQKTFTKWLSVYAESKGYEFQTRDSNGKGLFRLCNDTN